MAGGFGGQGMNVEDIFEHFGDIFGGAFGFWRRARWLAFSGGAIRSVEDQILRVRVKLTLEEIATGVEKKLKVNKLVQAEGVEYKYVRHVRRMPAA